VCPQEHVVDVLIARDGAEMAYDALATDPTLTAGVTARLEEVFRSAVGPLLDIVLQPRFEVVLDARPNARGSVVSVLHIADAVLGRPLVERRA
jgi:hypothetical protein